MSDPSPCVAAGVSSRFSLTASQKRELFLNLLPSSSKINEKERRPAKIAMPSVAKDAGSREITPGEITQFH
jgi:hypothetical protein